MIVCLFISLISYYLKEDFLYDISYNIYFPCQFFTNVVFCDFIIKELIWTLLQVLIVKALVNEFSTYHQFFKQHVCFLFLVSRVSAG